MPRVIESATRSERKAIERLLIESGLPTEDLVGPWHEWFLVAREAGAVVGAVGIEAHGTVALVRSLAVAPAHRHRGVASALLVEAEERARAAGVGSIHGLTVTAEAFLTKRGYERSDRASAPEAIRNSAEFLGLCPETAVYVRKQLG